MFPINQDEWIPYIEPAMVGNQKPCWMDIVGESANPASYYYIDPSGTSVAFRLRLNGSPLKDDSGKYELTDYVWGIQLLDVSNHVLFTARINALINHYSLQVLDAGGGLIQEEPILMSYPEIPENNARVISAGTIFSCIDPSTPDPDFFLDFTVPSSVFYPLNFSSSAFKMGYFTSTTDEVINKDYAYGPILHPPAGVPVLEVTPVSYGGATTDYVNTPDDWGIAVLIKNVGNVPVNTIVGTGDIAQGLSQITGYFMFLVNGDFFSYEEYLLSWGRSTLPPDEQVIVGVGKTGVYTEPGLKVFGSGIVTADGMATVVFSSPPTRIFSQNPLQLGITLSEGPVNSDSLVVHTWTLMIQVENAGDSPLTSVEVENVLASHLMLEAQPVFKASMGDVSIFPDKIKWAIGILPAYTHATLELTLNGFFTEAGYETLVTATASADGMTPVTAASTGVTVTSTDISKPVPVHLHIVDVESGHSTLFKATNSFSQEIRARLYDRFGRLVETRIFETDLDLSLEPGSSYVVELLREGYNRKLVVLIVGSEEEIRADIVMEKKRGQVSGSLPAYKADIFEGVVLEKYDADVIFSQDVILPTRAEVDAVYDRVDSVDLLVKCQSKLQIRLTVQKQVIYELDGTRQLLTRDYTETFCYPLNRLCENALLEHKAKVEKVYYCKEGIRLVNNATIKLRAYVVDYTDVFIHSKQIPDCE